MRENHYANLALDENFLRFHSKISITLLYVVVEACSTAANIVKISELQKYLFIFTFQLYDYWLKSAHYLDPLPIATRLRTSIPVAKKASIIRCLIR
jgi:hypothetical protein